MESTRSIGDMFVVGLPYLMGAVFVIGCFIRLMVYYTVRRHEWFAKEFEKRVNNYVESQVPGEVKDVSFFAIAKKMLERTYYESFEMRDRMKRRKNDSVMSMSDRVFLVKQGCAWLVKDILKQLKFLKWTNETPKLLNITKATFHHNPCFNRVFGVLPISSVNDVVSVMPGLFVVAGILGTFIGIAKGLPELAQMDMSQIENTKNIMDRFLGEIAFAMHSSIFGITFSLIMHLWNTVFSPERSYVSMIDRFESALDLLWYRSDNNNYPANIAEFDEHRNPLESLAEESLNSELGKTVRGRSFDEIRKAKVS